MGFVTRQTNSILDDTFSKQHWIGVSTTQPTVSGGNVSEPPKSSGYERAKLDKMGSASNGQITNTGIIYMGDITADIGTIGWLCIYESETATTPIYWGALTEAKEIKAGAVPLFRAGAIKIGLDIEAFSN